MINLVSFIGVFLPWAGYGGSDLYSFFSRYNDFIVYSLPFLLIFAIVYGILSKSKIYDEITMAMGGRAAEKIVFNEITTGASNDIEKATKMAKNMVTRYGMNDKLGPQVYGHREEQVFLGRELTEHDKNYSEKTAALIDEETNKAIVECYGEARKILNQNRSKLDLIAKELIEKETIEGKDFEKLMNKVDKAKKQSD